MEEQVGQEPQEIKLVVTEEMRSYLYESTKWTRFLAIIGFVLSVFLIMGSFGIGAALSANPGMLNALGPLAVLGPVGVSVLYLILALLYFYPSLLLFRFSRKAKVAVLYGDQEHLNDAMYNMKSLFKFFGILTLVVIVCYFLLVFIMAANMAKA